MSPLAIYARKTKVQSKGLAPECLFAQVDRANGTDAKSAGRAGCRREVAVGRLPSEGWLRMSSAYEVDDRQSWVAIGQSSYRQTAHVPRAMCLL